MSSIKISLFSQLLQIVDRQIFKKTVKEFDCDKFTKGITTWTHFVSMAFVHLANATSLRDISNGLRSASGNLSHLGIGRVPCKSSLSYINTNRDWRFFEQLYYNLVAHFEPSLRERKKTLSRIKRKIFIMDSTLIPLSLSLFNWATYRTKKGAAKIHAVLDYNLGLPTYAVITSAIETDLAQAQQTSFEKGSVLVIDRIYADYKWFSKLDSKGISFVVRIKKNVRYKIVEEKQVTVPTHNVISDKYIVLTGFTTSKRYSKKLRIVTVYDPAKDLKLDIITNNFYWTAQTVAQVYKARWEIEVFFKYLKQSIEVKDFVGVSPNAVRIQIWTALIVKLLFKYLQKKAKYKWNTSNLVAFVRFVLFVKIDLWKWLDNPIQNKANSPPQMSLF